MGLAETNSTLTARGRSGSSRPHEPGAARIPATVDSNAESAIRRFTKPGRATSAEAMSTPSGPVRIASASASAISSGDRRSGRASCIARLVARSPNAGFAGRSTSTEGAEDGSATAGSAPDASAAAHA